jgi:SLT domain-containing protein
MEGLSPMLLGRVLFQMQTESGGNPNAINLTDSNAAAGDPSRGLMQTIGSTFRAYHWPGTSSNIYDPLANIAAALNYARHRYGPSLMSGGMGIGSGHGYDAGGWLPPGLSLAYNGTGRPEAVIPGRGGGGQQIVLEVAPGGEGALTAALLNVLRKQIRIRGGDVQGALGRL